MRRHHAADDGMPRLVIGRELFLVLAHHHGAALCAHHDLVLGLFQVFHVDQALVGARGEQGGLVDQVGEVGAGETGCTASDDACLGVVRHRHLAHVYLEDLFTAAHIRQRHDDLAIETPDAAARDRERPAGWWRQ
jgi:hypothetical protein